VFAGCGLVQYESGMVETHTDAPVLENSGTVEVRRGLRH
jgi:hypothetical protein